MKNLGTPSDQRPPISCKPFGRWICRHYDTVMSAVGPVINETTNSPLSNENLEKAIGHSQLHRRTHPVIKPVSQKSHATHPLLLAYWTGTCTLIRQEAVPHLPYIVTIPNFSRKTITPIGTVEISLQDRIAHPIRRLLATPLGDQWADGGYVSWTASWPRQAKPRALVLVFCAPNILTPFSQRDQIIGNLNNLPAVWASRHIAPYLDR